MIFPEFENMEIIDNIRKYNMVEKQLNGLALDIWYALGLDFNDNMISLISLYNVGVLSLSTAISLNPSANINIIFFPSNIPVYSFWYVPSI